jgi:hypothetical protein
MMDLALHWTPKGIYAEEAVYMLDISPAPANTYWTDWGGWYDQFTGTALELYFGRYLSRVRSLDELRVLPWSIFIQFGTGTYIEFRINRDGILQYRTNNAAIRFRVTGDNLEYTGPAGFAARIDTDGHCYWFWVDTAVFVYISIPAHTWLWPERLVRGKGMVPVLSAPLDPLRPSRNILRRAEAMIRLETPSFQVKLSDGISGVVLNQSFSLNLHNNDGRFDGDEDWFIFNAPVRLYRSGRENPDYRDFIPVRQGFTESAATTFDAFRLNVSDGLASLDSPACGTIAQEDFDFPLLSGVEGRNIPAVYGKMKMKPQKIWEAKNAGGSVTAARYLLAECVTGVSAVYNRDGGSVRGWKLENRSVLYVPSGSEPDAVLFTGYTENRLGDVVTDLMTRRGHTPLLDSLWDREETAAYAGASPRVSIAFTSGSVKSAVQEALKSDMAFFIQRPDGRFTIRRWGTPYRNHIVPAETFTQKPQKDFSRAVKNWFSSCAVRYRGDDGAEKTFLLDSYEEDAERLYQKRERREFSTVLAGEEDARNLAELLAARFLRLKPDITIATGVDTSAFILLDTVTAINVINGREFSAMTVFAVTGVNPAQDVLTLEAVSETLLEFRLDRDGILRYRTDDPAIRFRIAGDDLEYTGPAGFIARIDTDGHCYWTIRPVPEEEPA